MQEFSPKSIFPQISEDQPAVVLAPMEGVTDAPMRALLTEQGGLTFCVAEFLRVTQDVLPAHVFFRHIPELKDGCRTAAGVPIQVQLLGGNAELLAENAKRACELGAQAIDLNFGCPSPTVNQHDGGATLLKYPHRIKTIVESVRKLVPKEIPVSAKLRLGWDSKEDIFINAEQAILGGASWITIHARTKVQGYAPPAYWEYIGQMKKRFQQVPIVANGDIWNEEDFLRCWELTGCQHFMTGRGLMANPALAQQISKHLGLSSSGFPSSRSQACQGPIWKDLLVRFQQIVESSGLRDRATSSGYVLSRMKQWLRMAHFKRPFPQFDRIKRSQSIQELLFEVESAV